MANDTTGLEHPRTVTMRIPVAAVATAGNDLTSVLGQARFSGKIVAAKYIPAATITGANTNSRTLTIVNKGQAGTGNVVAATLALTNGVNANAFTNKAIPVSGVASDVAIVAGDTLVLNSTHVGTGIADPGGVVEIEIANVGYQP